MEFNVVQNASGGFCVVDSNRSIVSHVEFEERRFADFLCGHLNIANSLETYGALNCKLRTNQSDHTEIAGILNKLLKSPEEVLK